MDASDRDTLGRVVRNAWIAWATRQPDCNPRWLVPYDDLEPRDREADVEIALAVLESKDARRVLLESRRVVGMHLTHGEADELARLRLEYYRGDFRVSRVDDFDGQGQQEDRAC